MRDSFFRLRYLVVDEFDETTFVMRSTDSSSEEDSGLMNTADDTFVRKGDIVLDMVPGSRMKDFSP